MPEYYFDEERLLDYVRDEAYTEGLLITDGMIALVIDLFQEYLLEHGEEVDND